MTFTEKTLSLEEKAKTQIIRVLERYGCKVMDISIDKILSLKPVYSDIKKAFKDYKGSKFDLLIARNKTGEFYLCECKGKSFDSFRNIVNVNSYDVYFEFASLPFPFVYFVWIEENGLIYTHSIVNPKDFERSYMRDKEVYRIPLELMHEIKPSEFERIDAWLRCLPIDKKHWLKQIWEALSI